jgi:hypothetical protein
MRAQEFLPEIERISRGDYAGGKDYLGTGGASRKELKPLPGGSGLFYSVQTDYNDIYIKLWDPQGPEAEPGRPQIIGKLTLEKPWDFPIPNAIQVSTITTDEDYRGRGLAKAMYGIVLTILKRPLVAGGSQTPGGRQNWVSLASIPGVEMKGYVSIDDEEIDPGAPQSRFSVTTPAQANKNIDTIMGKLGGQFIGTGRTDRHYFAFDVKPTTSGKELEAFVKQNLARVYDENYNTITGLYAVWTGK